MKAAVLRQTRSPLVIEEIEIDNPGPREVLIRTAACGACHSDLHFLDGIYPMTLPFVPGHEAAGVVEKVGDQVRGLKVGDHVITCLSVFCGRCELCLTGRLSLCISPETKRGKGDAPRLRQVGGGAMTQMLQLGAFAEQMVVHENACVAVNRDMPLDRAALIGCAVMTGYGAVSHTAQVRPGDTVAVIGCGGIGLSLVQSARLAGAARIIAIDRVASKLALAKDFGATDVVDAGAGDPVEQVQALTGGGVQFSFEAIGLKATAEQAWRMLRRGGCATLLGMIPPGVKLELHGPDFLAEKRIQGSLMGSNHFPVDMPRIVDLYLQGRFKLDELISQRLPLAQVNEAFETMRSGELARSVVVFG